MHQSKTKIYHFKIIVLLFWNAESQNTPQRILKTVECTVYYTRGSKGNQFPTRTLMFLRGPVFTPDYMTGYMLATSLLYMIELYNK